MLGRGDVVKDDKLWPLYSLKPEPEPPPDQHGTNFPDPDPPPSDDVYPISAERMPCLLTPMLLIHDGATSGADDYDDIKATANTNDTDEVEAAARSSSAPESYNNPR